MTLVALIGVVGKIGEDMEVESFQDRMRGDTHLVIGTDKLFKELCSKEREMEKNQRRKHG